MAKLSDTHYSYTQSFLHQLQTEWKEFWFEVGQCDPCEVAECISNEVDAKQPDARENLVESLNKFNTTSDGNIIIPVPLKTLRRLFSPSKCNADDVFKIELLNEIKENLNLTSVTCKKLQKLLLPNDTLEVSDFPTPSIVTNHRKSAPARLLNKKKIKSKQLFDNEFRIDFKNKENIPNLPLQVETKNKENEGKNKKLDNLMRSIIDSSDDENLLSAKNNVLKNSNNNVLAPIKNTSEKPNCPDRRKLLSIKKTKKTKTLREYQAEGDNAEKQRYSSVYDLKIDTRDSSNLFVTGKSQKKNGKPTIVCTYFSQAELGKIYQTVKQLGFFDIENNVSAKTTHLICGSSKKTVNLCKAVARGCWILDKEWVFLSSVEGRWLYEERFEKYDLSPAIKENRMKRQKYGPVYRCNIFAECGSIYVDKNCDHPKAEDIKELVILGGGHLTDNLEKAKFIIGYVPQRECLKETWILSCIMQGHVLNITKHFRKN